MNGNAKNEQSDNQNSKISDEMSYDEHRFDFPIGLIHIIEKERQNENGNKEYEILLMNQTAEKILEISSGTEKLSFSKFKENIENYEQVKTNKKFKEKTQKIQNNINNHRHLEGHEQLEDLNNENQKTPTLLENIINTNITCNSSNYINKSNNKIIFVKIKRLYSYIFLVIDDYNDDRVSIQKELAGSFNQSFVITLNHELKNNFSALISTLEDIQDENHLVFDNSKIKSFTDLIKAIIKMFVLYNKICLIKVINFDDLPKEEVKLYGVMNHYYDDKYEGIFNYKSIEIVGISEFKGYCINSNKEYLKNLFFAIFLYIYYKVKDYAKVQITKENEKYEDKYDITIVLSSSNGTIHKNSNSSLNNLNNKKKSTQEINNSCYGGYRAGTSRMMTKKNKLNESDIQKSVITIDIIQQLIISLCNILGVEIIFNKNSNKHTSEEEGEEKFLTIKFFDIEIKNEDEIEQSENKGSLDIKINGHCNNNPSVGKEEQDQKDKDKFNNANNYFSQAKRANYGKKRRSLFNPTLNPAKRNLFDKSLQLPIDNQVANSPCNSKNKSNYSIFGKNNNNGKNYHEVKFTIIKEEKETIIEHKDSIHENNKEMSKKESDNDILSIRDENKHHVFKQRISDNPIKGCLYNSNKAKPPIDKRVNFFQSPSIDNSVSTQTKNDSFTSTINENIKPNEYSIRNKIEKLCNYNGLNLKFLNLQRSFSHDKNVRSVKNYFSLLSKKSSSVSVSKKKKSKSGNCSSLNSNRCNCCDIAIVDDEKYILDALEKAIKKQGLKCDRFVDGKYLYNKILEKINNKCNCTKSFYKLIISDIKMNIWGGLQTSQEIEKLIDKGKLSDNFSFIFISGHKGKDLELPNYKFVKGYYQKPLVKNTIYQILEDFYLN